MKTAPLLTRWEFPRSLAVRHMIQVFYWLVHYAQGVVWSISRVLVWPSQRVGVTRPAVHLAVQGLELHRLLVLHMIRLADCVVNEMP